MSKRMKIQKNDAVNENYNLLPRNTNQKKYINSIYQKDVTIATGVAGCGKTYISTAMACELYNKGIVKKLILTRPTVPCGDDFGTLPGDVNEKIAPWAVPYLDIMKKFISKGALDCAIKNENIQFVPLQLMRGRSLDDSFIICDEAQNTTPKQIVMLTTRLGENSKLVVNGDESQSDLVCKGISGLSFLLNMTDLSTNDIIGKVSFKIDDCQRSYICKRFIELYSKESI